MKWLFGDDLIFAYCVTFVLAKKKKDSLVAPFSSVTQLKNKPIDMCNKLIEVLKPPLNIATMLTSLSIKNGKE